jgi:hypothetical protein
MVCLAASRLLLAVVPPVEVSILQLVAVLVLVEM